MRRKKNRVGTKEHCSLEDVVVCASGKKNLSVCTEGYCSFVWYASSGKNKLKYCLYSAYSTGPARSRLSLPSARRGVVASSHACLVVDRSCRTSIARPEGLEVRGCGSGRVWKCGYPFSKMWSLVFTSTLRRTVPGTCPQADGCYFW